MVVVHLPPSGSSQYLRKVIITYQCTPIIIMESPRLCPPVPSCIIAFSLVVSVTVLTTIYAKTTENASRKKFLIIIGCYQEQFFVCAVLGTIFSRLCVPETDVIFLIPDFGSLHYQSDIHLYRRLLRQSLRLHGLELHREYSTLQL